MEPDSETEKFKEMIKTLPKEFFPNIDKDKYKNLINYHESLGNNQPLDKIYTLFLIKSIEDKNFSLEKYGNLFNALEKSQEYFENDDNTNIIINSIENKQLFEKINQVYKLLDVDICFPYLAYQYMKFFGENSKNFQEILIIVMNSIYHDDIKCDFNFPFDDNFYDNVELFVSSFQNKKNNQINNYYLIKKKENENESITINNLNIIEETNLLKEEYKSRTHEDIKENNKEEENENPKKENNKNNNNENINNSKQIGNNPKKNKKRKIRNKTKNLRAAREKQKKEKSEMNDKVNKHDNAETSQNLENEIIQMEKSSENNIINDNDEFSIENENENKIDNIDSPNIDILRSNLKPKEKLRDYFKRMYNYYKIGGKKKHYFLYDLANNDYYPLENKFKFKINYDQFPFISNMFKFLKMQLEPVKDTNNKEVYREYQGSKSFGYLIHDNCEYFYVFKNKFNRDLFNNINYVKQYEYDKAFQIHNSFRYSNASSKENFNGIDSHFLTSEYFENRINHFFLKFDLKQLPNYFFRLIKKNVNECPFYDDYNNNKTNMKYVDDYYFSSFVEIDGAFAYLNSTKKTIIYETNELFKCSKTISISSHGEKIEIDNDELDLTIKPNTIILIEDKLSFPKVIKNLTKNETINKDELFASMNFLIYKIIKKINIFESYLNSTSEGKKNKYFYYLILIYDSNPILNVENIVIDVIKELKKEGLIKYSSFQLKVIYILPCITLNESNEIDEMKKKIKDLEKKLELMEQRKEQSNNKKK